MSAPTSTPTATLPATMRAWVFDATDGGIEKTMRLVPDHPVPEAFARVTRGDVTGPGGSDAIVVRVLYAALNPVDYKAPAMPLIGRLLQRRPATPSVDFCGRVVAATAPGFAPGQLVAGKTKDLVQHGALAQFTLAHSSLCVAVPPGVDPVQAATIGVGGTTAWGSVAPYVQKVAAAASGKPVHIFINGGSGGVGAYAVQIAKALGCTVTTTCSTGNVALVRSLGADHVIDYRETAPAEKLSAMATTTTSGEPGPVDAAVDMVGNSFALYRAGDAYLAPGAPFVLVGTQVRTALHITLRPGFLGGGHHPVPFYMNKTDAAGLQTIMDYVASGQIKVPIEKVFPMEDARAAYALLRTERARGKIVVKVAEDE